MEGSCVLTVISVILLLHSSSCMGSLNLNEELYNGFDVLTKVSTVLLRKEAFPELYGNPKLRDAVRPICPLMDKYNEIKQHIDSGKAANLTELKAAQTVLAHVLNDTCIWIRSIPKMENFTCSTNQLDDLESLCIEITIKDIAFEQRKNLFQIYSHESKIEKTYSLPYNKEWIMNTFSGQDTVTIDEALNVITRHNGYRKCARVQQTVSC